MVTGFRFEYYTAHLLRRWTEKVFVLEGRMGKVLNGVIVGVGMMWNQHRKGKWGAWLSVLSVNGCKCITSGPHLSPKEVHVVNLNYFIAKGMS